MVGSGRYFLPQLISRAAGGFAVVSGMVALVGWRFNLPRLTDWTNQGIAMLPNTALCGMLIGASIVLLTIRQRRWVTRVARGSAGLAALFAALTLLQHIMDINVGIDTLLIKREWGQTATAAPMRMGPPASLAYLVLGIALVLTTFGSRARRIASYLSVFAALIALLSLTGYWFGANQLFGVAKFTGIALLTSTIIAALSIGVMALVVEWGIPAVLTKDDAGGAVFRRLVLPIIVVPLVLGWLRIVGQDFGLYSMEFGTALRSLIEISLLFTLLWWTANSISWHATSAESAESRLAAIVESSEDAIVAKTLGGVIQSWNAGAERTFGYPADEAIGQHISLIIPPERINEESDIVTRLRKGERIAHFETIRVRKDGTPITVSLSVSPIKSADGRIVGASKIARDITARKQLEIELEQLLESERVARNEAERASQLKDEFLATLSHELRTPLNAIVGWSQILDADSDPNELTEGLDAIRRNARAQVHLIDDLLDMSRIISGKVRLDVHVVDMANVIDAAIEAVHPAAEAKGIQLRKIIDYHAGHVSGDPTRLQQVVWNLLSNSIKFTPKEGKIDVILERVNSHLELTVHDSGIGIAPDYLEVIFQRFRQVDSSTTRSYGGLGIGLSIVKQLVELHGGTVEAASEGEGKGSTFVIALPLMAVRQASASERPATAKSPLYDCGDIELAGVKVLVIDDESDARALVQRVLTQCGAEVRLAESAAEGLKELVNFRPQVLVSDIGMPEVDGYQFIRSVRGLPPDKGGKTPAVALTAFARSEDRTRAMLAGYQVHVAKPIEPRELAVTVHSLSHHT